MTEPTKCECYYGLVDGVGHMQVVRCEWCKGLEGNLKHAQDIIRRKKISIEHRDAEIERLKGHD